MRLPLKTLRDPVHLLAFGFGAGLVPRAPGTVASAVALLPAWLTYDAPFGWRVALVAVVALAGIWICGESARRLGTHDHPGIVFDEIAGVLATALAMPSRSIFWIGLVFVFFRIFDIAKPWPIRDVDHRLGGGLGIILDDLMAAVYAAVCLLILQVSLPTI
jgi:phosphatidylglycerophosphatase A